MRVPAAGEARAGTEALSALHAAEPTATQTSVAQVTDRLREVRPAPGAPLRPHVPVRVAEAAPGPVDIAALCSEANSCLGLYVLEGQILVELAAGRSRVGWLTGAGDLLRPWEMDEITLTRRTAWRAITPTRLAVLDGDFARRAASVPSLMRELVSRAAQTSHWLLAKSLVTSAPVVEEKLLLLFALYGERWGRMSSAGVVLDLPLTHSLLAVLCGTRRPTVTTAVHALERDGILSRTETLGWLLRRDAPAAASQPSCWEQYVEALGLA